MSQDAKDSAIPLAEISQGPSKFELFLDRNQKNLFVLGILIAIGAAGWVVYDGIRTGKMESAGIALTAADDLPALQQVIKENPDTPAAGSARLLLAERQWTDGQQETAIETLRSLIDSNPSHPAAPNAKASLAAKYMTQGKPDEAKKLFQELVDNPDASFLAPFALVSLGDIALAAGEKETATKYYQQAQTGHALSPFTQTAVKRIPIVDAKAPAEIDPPPAPDPTEPAPADEAPGFQITPVPDTGSTPETSGDDNAGEPAAESAEDAPEIPAEAESTEPEEQ